MYVALIFLLDRTATEQRGGKAEGDLKHSGQGTNHRLIFRILNRCFGKLDHQLIDTEAHLWATERLDPQSWPPRESFPKGSDSFTCQAPSQTWMV